MKAFYENRSYNNKFIPLAIYKHENKRINFHAHWHSDIEIIYVLEGSINIGINGDNKTLYKNEIALCSSGDIHFYNNTDKESSIYIFVVKPFPIGFHRNWPEDFNFKSAYVTRVILEKNGLPTDLNFKIKEILDNIYEEMKLKKACYNIFMASGAMELFGLCQRYIPSTETNMENKRLSRLKTIQEILQYIEANYMHPLTLADTATHFNLSTFHFCRLFKSLTGTNFKHYLDTVRINNAEDQIKSTNNSITNIALECGYNNIRTFNRVFKSIRGYTPSSIK